MLENRLSINIDKANIVYETINYSIMKTLVIALFISMLPSLLTISYAGDSVGKDSPVLSTGANSLDIDEQWSQFIQLVDEDEDDYKNLEAFLKNLENKEFFLKSQYTEEDEEVTYTPLHYASGKSVPKVVELLIEQGADVYATVKNELTPLHYAVAAYNFHTVEFLLSYPLELKPDDKGFTPLHTAILRKSQNIIDLFKDRMLRERKLGIVALKAQDSFGNTPVHYAFGSRKATIASPIVTMLISLASSDIKQIMETKNNSGDTPQKMLERMILQDKSDFSKLQQEIKQKILK